MSRSKDEWAFSKIFVKKILTPEDWGLDLHAQRYLKQYPYPPKTYSYFDYIEAWEGALIYENRARKHSWFILFQLDDKVEIKFPAWFITWYFHWGLFPVSMPVNLKVYLKEFQKSNPELAPLKGTIAFITHYQVPWIVRWDYTISQTEKIKYDLKMQVAFLCRRTLMKWWNKFDFFHKNGVYERKGIVSLNPQKVPLTPLGLPSSSKGGSIKELLKELIASSSKEDLKKSLIEAFEEAESERSSENSIMQDAQDPDATFSMES